MNKVYSALGVGLLSLASGLVFARPPHLHNFDADNDGSVTRAEAESAAAARAQKIDVDGNAVITVDELRADHERRKLERMEKRLNKADSNGDGVIGLDEFSAQMVGQVMRRDANGDGVISKADRAERGPRPGRGGPR